MITAEGFCTDCRTWVLDAPGLRCPTCRHGSLAEVLSWVGLSALAEPEKVLAGVAVALREVAVRRRELLTLRARAARAAIATGRHGRHRRATLDGWASYGLVARCSAGHERAETGYRLGRRWRCTVCDGPGPPPPAAVSVEEMRSPARKAAARERYRHLLGQREAAMERAAEELNPPRLRPPLQAGR